MQIFNRFFLHRDIPLRVAMKGRQTGRMIDDDSGGNV